MSNDAKSLKKLIPYLPQLIEAVLSAEYVISDPECAKEKGTFQQNAKNVYAAATTVRSILNSNVVASAHTDTERLDWLDSEHFGGDIRRINGVSMDGSVPCYKTRSPKRGGCTTKTLREAIDANMEEA